MRSGPTAEVAAANPDRRIPYLCAGCYESHSETTFVAIKVDSKAPTAMPGMSEPASPSAWCGQKKKQKKKFKKFEFGAHDTPAHRFPQGGCPVPLRWSGESSSLHAWQSQRASHEVDDGVPNKTGDSAGIGRSRSQRGQSRTTIPRLIEGQATSAAKPSPLRAQKPTFSLKTFFLLKPQFVGRGGTPESPSAAFPFGPGNLSWESTAILRAGPNPRQGIRWPSA